MRRLSGLHLPALAGGLLLTACADSTGPASPSLECSAANIQNLAVGQHVIIDPFEAGACVRIPPAGAQGAEHLYVPVGTEAQETEEGVSAPYSISGTSALAAAFGRSSRATSALRRQLPSQTFHDMLRRRERELSRRSDVALSDNGRTARALASPPVVGEQRTFNVCTNDRCTSFAAVTATARFVGQTVAIFLDNEAPAGGYDDADLTDVGNLFDDHLYAIDTTAFGRESDIDGNSVVMVVLSPRVNALGGCGAGSVTVGYFFGGDLLTGLSGSNQGEVFFGLAPDGSQAGCEVTREDALRLLPTGFVHEFQHMISFNQHRLVRGRAAEETWLNEGLSHFAEELAGRKVPDSECPVSGSCFSDFLRGDVFNAFEYLQSPEDFFLVLPGSGTGSFAERGANWLFVRWLADHFAADPVSGADLTRRLVMTNLTGADNVASQTGVPFSILAPEWQLTNYVDDLPGFSATADRLRYKTWNFRDIQVNGRPFPLVPDSTAGPDYSHLGILLAGSGKHVRIVQPPGFAAVDLQLSGGTGNPFPSEVSPRIALVRIR